MNYRPNTRPAIGHMPFEGHRTCREVREQEGTEAEKKVRHDILRGLGRDDSERTQRRKRRAA